jgi:hypothetical protein
MKIITYIF